VTDYVSTARHASLQVRGHRVGRAQDLSSVDRELTDFRRVILDQDQVLLVGTLLAAGPNNQQTLTVTSYVEAAIQCAGGFAVEFK
jgi:hypothetical protein